MSNPYSSLPGSAFWKTAVGERNALDVVDVARPKQRIAPTDRVATGGSCFAQHISRRLRQNGFAFVDVEPAPRLLAPEHRPKYGYELYSARYGNIYTSTQLRQLILRALDRFAPAEPAWENDGRWYDPFRPSIEPGGFDSREELLEHQRTHLNMVRRMLKGTDVFVFTLGLTETWRSVEDGAVYPTCPGTQAGTFDPDRYEFVNLTFPEVLADMQEVLGLLAEFNPAMRVLLTVSPVPLTATASGEHVLVATTYSKSVLRAVAGQLAAEHDNVDYFPSYELITAPPFGGRWFSDNKRTVRSEGVDFVMATFFREFCAGDEAAAQAQVPAPSTTAQPVAARGPAEDEEEETDICDEQILEFYASAE